MNDTSVLSLQKQAVAALRAKQFSEAQRFLQEALQADRRNATTWWLISYAYPDEPAIQRKAIQKALEITPNDVRLIQRNAELDVQRPSPGKETPQSPDPKPVGPDPASSPHEVLLSILRNFPARRLPLAMVGGVGALILVTLVASLLNRPAATPEGVVLRFWQALQANDDNGVLDTLGDRPRDQNASLLVGCGGAVRCLKPETPANPQGVSTTISAQRDTSARVMLRVQGTYKDVQGAYCADIGVNKINGEWKIVDLSGTFVLCPSQAAAIAQQATAYPQAVVATATPNRIDLGLYATATMLQNTAQAMAHGPTLTAQILAPYWTQTALVDRQNMQASQIAATATQLIEATQISLSETAVAHGLTATSALLTQTAVLLTQTETALMRLPGRIVVSTNGQKYQSVAFTTLQSTEIPGLSGRNALQFSPDGKQVVEGRAFETNFIANADGSQRRPLDYGLTDPAWSPDGKRFVVELTAQNPQKGYEFDDKLYIALSTDFSQRTEVMNVATKTSISGYQFAWSPDGQQIAYIQTKDKRLYTIQPNGTHGKLLFADYSTVTNLEMGWPAWSPDSQHIAFWLYKSHVDSGVYLMNADGTQVRRVTPLTVVCSGPAWSPDGHYLSVSCALPDQPYNRQVFITPIDGAWQIQVGRLDGVGDWTRWVN